LFCFKCHAAGTIAPKDARSGSGTDRHPGFYAVIGKKNGDMNKINRKCAMQDRSARPGEKRKFGPDWIEPPSVWTDATASPGWDKAKHVDAPEGCGGCHSEGFISPGPATGNTFCNVVAAPAFAKGGSMHDKQHNWSEDDCEDFALEMGCSPEQFHCGAAAGTGGAR